MTSKTTLAASLLAMAFLTLTACSGNGNAAQTLPTTANNPMAPPAVQPEDRQSCSSDGDLRINPCRVTFDSGNPGPVDVMVSRGNRNGRDDGDRHALENAMTARRATSRRSRAIPNTSTPLPPALLPVRAPRASTTTATTEGATETTTTEAAATTAGASCTSSTTSEPPSKLAPSAGASGTIAGGSTL